jgi:hypothetical protein
MILPRLHWREDKTCAQTLSSLTAEGQFAQQEGQRRVPALVPPERQREAVPPFWYTASMRKPGADTSSTT